MLYHLEISDTASSWKRGRKEGRKEGEGRGRKEEGRRPQHLGGEALRPPPQPPLQLF